MKLWLKNKVIELLNEWLVLALALILVLVVAEWLNRDFMEQYLEVSESVQRLKIKLSMALN